MDTFSEKELERIRKLEQLRRLLQTILGNHIRLLIILFAVILTTIFMIVYLKAVFSPSRYEAQAILYYFPKETGKIHSYNAKYVLQVLSRSAVRHQFMLESWTRSQHKPKKPPKLSVALIERKNKVDRFEVRVSSRYSKTAITLTNAFAEHCVRAYIEDRTASLQEMRQALLKKKNDIFNEIQRLDREKNSLGAPLGRAAMDREYEQLRFRIAEQQTARSKLSLAIGSLERRRITLRKRHSKLNPALIANEKFLREQIAVLKKLDQDIMLAENLYTPQNPKMITLAARRQLIRDRLRKFLNEKNITENDFEHLEEILEITAALKTIDEEVENRREEMDILDQELKETNERFERLCEAMPRIQIINQQYTNLNDSLQKLDASLSDINYLLPLVKDDLRIGEPSNSAYGLMPFTKKNIFICVFAAVSLTMLLASLTVLLEFWWGKVSSENELSIIPELCYLGKLPAADGMFESKRHEQIAFSTVCHNFRNSEVEHRVVLAGNLPGGRLIHSLFDAFEWTYAMAGKRTLTIDMVLADNFDYEAYPPGDTGIIVYSGGKGFLPVVSKHYLSPSEFMLLKQDLEILGKSFDLIFIKHSLSLRSDRLFLEQIIELCDGAILAVGAGKTTRRHLRQLISLQKKTKLPIMTIFSENSPRQSAPENNQEMGI